MLLSDLELQKVVRSLQGKTPDYTGAVPKLLAHIRAMNEAQAAAVAAAAAKAKAAKAAARKASAKKTAAKKK
mgnify:CR=1 FL=1